MKSPRPGIIRIGISGWQTQAFEGTLYTQKGGTYDKLAHYATRFATVEINRTFYNFPKLSTAEKWVVATPPGFQVALKAHRSFTHEHPLADPDGRLDEFFERARVLGAGDRAGPVLFQLAAGTERDVRALDRFAARMPRDVRVTFELRSPTWETPRVREILESRGIAWCVFDIRQREAPASAIAEPTAPFAYVRLHGPDKTPYRGSYSPEALACWADRIRGWSQAGADVYVFFDNTMTVAALDNAWSLADLVKKPHDLAAPRISDRAA